MKKVIDKLGINKVIIFACFACVGLMFCFAAIKWTYIKSDSIEIITDLGSSVVIGIFTGYISGYVVSSFFSEKSKIESMKSEVVYMLNSLGFFRELMGKNPHETEENFKDISNIISDWKSKLNGIEMYLKMNKYSDEDINIVNNLISRLDNIKNLCKIRKNDYLEIAGRDLIGVWIELNKIIMTLDK